MKPNLARLLILLALTILVVAGYLITSNNTYQIGFPLDDAWIHQTYARNLIEFHSWVYLPGQPSAGSTSPLWSTLLAAGYLAAGIPYAWTFFLGGLCLFLLGWAGEIFYRRFTPNIKTNIPWVGIFLIGEWHLVWASLSGMETILFALVILFFFLLIGGEKPSWWGAGILAGVSVWIRPDGITLLGPAFFVLLLAGGLWRDKLTKGLKTILGFLIFFLPYLLFNNWLSGNWWPNTFYAKQAEYAVLQQIPFLERYFSIISLPLVGAGILLLPGFLYTVWKAIQERNWLIIAAAIWWACYSGLYALRLPVTYQHGRYLIPAMPIYFTISLIGVSKILQIVQMERPIQRVASRVWLITIGCVWLAFCLIGAMTYSKDVAIIEAEMVTTARWVAENTAPESVIAVHDIGALGYFSRRNLVDLAGLISPKVIPFIRDEKKLASYMDEKQVDYLVSFPKWYPDLVKQGRLVYKTDGLFSPEAGGENMAVYRWRSR
jgi:hypothetical protein